MPRRVLIGIDVGTSVLKAAAFDRSTARMLAGRSRRLHTRTGSSGQREQDASRLWTLIRKLLHELTQSLDNRDKVVGIGLAAQGGSAVIVDHISGKPRSPLFLWNDMRFLPYMDCVRAAHPKHYWQKLALRDEPGWGLARMLWLRDTWADMLSADALYVGIGELLFHKLTGVWQQDTCNAHQIGCYDAKNHRLDGKPLKTAGTTLDQIAPLRVGAGTTPLSRKAAGELGLAEGIDVIGPFMDHEAGFMSIGDSHESPMQCSLGTAWVGNYSPRQDTSVRSPFHFVIPEPMGNGPFVIQPLLTGNVCWDWALTSFLDTRIRKALEKAEAVFTAKLLPDPGLMALPWLNMPNALWPDSLGSCAFFGAQAATDRSELVRAIALAMVCEFRRVFEEPIKHGLIRSLILSGGASKSPVFQHLISSVFSPLPVYVVVDEDWFGARGVLRPLSENVGQVSTRLTKRDKDVDPAEIGRCYARYVDLYDRLYKDIKAGEAIYVSERRAS